MSIIGTGNTATILGKCLKMAGHRIVQILGRDPATTCDLAELLGAKAAVMEEPIDQTVAFVLVAVSDSAISNVISQFNFPVQSIVIHTAASVSKDVLKGKAAKYGVFYPLQSLKKELERLPEIPIVIDADSEETLQQLRILAQSITRQTFSASDEQRLKLHMAAVMVNNFTNHLYALIEGYCRKEGLDFSVLLPLILETSSRLKEISPQHAQTGPAVRNDTATIEKHLSLLQNHPGLQRFYQLFTESIQQEK
ncbi:DUF2520 domain-containing protein [Flavisolibacter sp. BT320]|nr:DUF2520 domain-containing protein [Flavisolibacter longurius]